MKESRRVLLVEDNPADIDLVRECFSTSASPIDVTVAASGTEALDYLRQRGRQSSALVPHLILLDLNLPGTDGHAVLKAIKEDAGTRSIPVSILTSSTNQRDVARSYSLGANCYIVKPLDFGSCQQIMRTIANFWFSTVTLAGGQSCNPGEAD